MRVAAVVVVIGLAVVVVLVVLNVEVVVGVVDVLVSRVVLEIKELMEDGFE